MACATLSNLLQTSHYSLSSLKKNYRSHKQCPNFLAFRSRTICHWLFLGGVALSPNARSPGFSKGNSGILFRRSLHFQPSRRWHCSSELRVNKQESDSQVINRRDASVLSSRAAFNSDKSFEQNYDGFHNDRTASHSDVTNKNSHGSLPFAWLGQRDASPEDTQKAEEQTKIMLEKLAEDQKQFLLERNETIQFLEMQRQREFLQQFNIRKAVLKFQGKLKGTQWDPLPGDSIRFSDFFELLTQKKIKFLEYAEHGKNVAVILPHIIETSKGGDNLAKGDNGENNASEIVWAKHPVEQMPADMQTEIWSELRTQVINVDFKYPNSVANQVLPSVGVAAVWVLRLIFAVVLFRVVDHFLFPFYKPKSLKERPEAAPVSLEAAMKTDLGVLGESRARFISAEQSTGVTFDDFAGQEYVKRELKEVVRLLKDEGDYESLGVYCPKGVMLFGPPGTGKTLLARAIAGEAGIPFFSVSGSEFVEMFVGVAAARVRSLFEKARQFAPSIIFIDEIDAIGSKRGLGEAGGGSVEREQGLMQILTEMDGFKVSSKKVLVIGATNRLDMLDPALLRKGRFDRVVAVQRPTEEGRLAILKVHSRNKQFQSEEEKESLLKEVSTITYDYSGAELQNVLNEAAILSMRKEKDFIGREELLEAIQRQAGEFKTGEEDKEDVTGEAKIRICYREASICLLECILPDPSRTFTMTRADSLSPQPQIEYDPVRHIVYYTKEQMINAIIRALAPLNTEELIFGEKNVAWTMNTCMGEASQLAEYLILQTGFTSLGLVTYNTEADLMPHMVPKVIALRDEIIRYCKEKCHAYLVHYRSALETIAERLMEKNELYASEIWSIFNATPLLSMPHVRDIDEYGAVMYAGRWGIHGVSLPGRITFTPNVGFATFGAAMPQQVALINERTWKAMDDIRATNVAKFKQEIESLQEDSHVDVFNGLDIV